MPDFWPETRQKVKIRDVRNYSYSGLCAQDRLLGADNSPWVVSASKKKAAEDEIAALEASWHVEAEQEADESDEECGIPVSHRHGSPTGKQGSDLMAAKKSRQARWQWLPIALVVVAVSRSAVCSVCVPDSE